MKLPIAYYGDPILRKKGARVEEINDEIRQLVADMIETMDDKDGIGLAAPQVHRSLALFITRAPIPPKAEDEEWTSAPLRVFINPKISDPTPEGWETSEGCLSIPGVYAPVTRPWKVKVEATNLEGERFEEEFSGYEARVIMHENDHINGVLFIDRVLGRLRQELDPKLREIKKRYSIPK